MGYPTNALSTARGRAAVGLSTRSPLPTLSPAERQLFQRSLASFRMELTEAERALLRFQGGAKGPPLTYKFPLDAIPKPASVPGLGQAASVGGRGVAATAAEAAATAAPYIARTAAGALRGGFVGAGGWLLAELAAQAINNHGAGFARPDDPAPSEWTWPDPADYDPGSYVQKCPDDGPNAGPFGSGGTCGVLYSFAVDQEPYVNYTLDSEGRATSTQWNLYHRLDPAGRTCWTVWRARYYHDSAPVANPGPDNTPWPTEYPNLTSPDTAGNEVRCISSMMDPLSVPPTALQNSAPTPWRYKLLPRRKPNPWRSPSEQTSWGPVPAPSRGMLPPPERLRHRRPPRRTKERKGQGVKRGAFVALGWALQVTEVNDFVDALWDALPTEKRTKRASISQKYADLYRSWSSLDIEEAIENVIINAIEDAVIGLTAGQLDSLKRSVNERLGKPNTPYWQHKSLSPDYEGDLAQLVSDIVEGAVRDLVEL